MSMAPATDPLTAARRAIDAGRPADARALLVPLAAEWPADPMVRVHLARADAALGDNNAAREGFDAALAAAPQEPGVWLERALFAHAVGDGAALIRRARGAGLTPPLLAMVASAVAGTGARAQGAGGAGRRDLAALSAALKTGDARAVEASAVVLLRARPGAMVWAMLGQARLRAGAPARAVEAFRAGLRLEPYAADLRLGLAMALARAGQGPAALAAARTCTVHAPAWADAHLTLARIALSLGLAAQGDAAAQTARTLAPGSDAALKVAAQAALAAGRPLDALDLASRRRTGAAGRALLLGRAAAAARRDDAALEAFAAAVAAGGADADEARLARAQLLQSLGRVEDAETDLTDILARHPGHGTAARALAYGRRLDADGPETASMRAALDDPATGADDRRLLRYALARTLERADPAASFAHLAQANAATAAAFPHDGDVDRAEFDRAARDLWARLGPSDSVGACTAAPIFVTGLPRSGTTLIEAVLAAHPDTRAGGELAVTGGVLARFRTALDGTPDAATLTAMGDAWVRAADEASGGADPRRLTDKSIHSWVHMGLIRRMLPASRMVVVHRDPRDAGLSIWRNHFRDGSHRYASTIDGIADHIALFRDAVAFWRDALPPGSFHDIAYEALLDDPEGEARRLLAFCGLPWTPAVLAFHEGRDRVDTLSFAQVRQPLYATSRGAWQAHAAHLAPLIAALAARGVDPDAPA